jgi:hypothetical protein
MAKKEKTGASAGKIPPARPQWKGNVCNLYSREDSPKQATPAAPKPKEG